jgi:pimeloyl-ACP methyl ester carboxylesterase
VAAGYRVITFDQRGHAGTSGTAPCTSAAAARDYRTLLEHFGVRDGTLVAHSMGGFLGLLFCLEHRDAAKRLRRLVLLGANAGAVASGSLQNKLQIPLLQSGVMPYLWRVAPIGNALVRGLFGREPDPQFVKATRAILLGQDVRRSLPLLHALCYENYYARVREIGVETVVLCGEFDRTSPGWHSQELGANLPHATNRWLPDVGHMLMYEAPQAVVDAVSSDRATQRDLWVADQTSGVHTS